MDLFSQSGDTNLLPYGGTVIYYGAVLSREEADAYFDRLLETTAWKPDEALIFGKHFYTNRKVAWYGERDFSYTYSNTLKTPLPWTTDLLALKKIAEDRIGCAFNSCLCNLYHSGEEGMAWHSDGEKALGKNTRIASFSFGAERKFAFKHKKTKETRSLILAHGSLLLMQDETQSNWLHRLPPTTKIKRPRINLTFRTIVQQ